MKILVNDGIEESGKIALENAGYHVDMQSIPQDELPVSLPFYDAICVRSNTKVRKDLIDLCPNLKIIARGGVGLDNIDVEYARHKGIKVINTPAASSRSVAELVLGHAFSLSRFLDKAHREMPVSGHETFGILKKSYAQGQELTGKTMGIVGLGRIGQELASLAMGIGMKVKAYDPFVTKANIGIGHKDLKFYHELGTVSLEEVLTTADYISLHIPSLQKPVLDEEAFAKMKDGIFILNASRGESIDEEALLKNLDSGKVAAAGLDVFCNEPKPDKRLLQHPRISATPHIGASTLEAQEKIGLELAQQIIEVFS